MPSLRERFDEYTTEYLLEHARAELTPEAREALHDTLAQRGISADAIAAAARSPRPPSAQDRLWAAARAPAPAWLARLSSLATLLAAGFLFYALMRENGSRSPVQLLRAGDADAALYWMLAVSASFGAGVAVLALLSRRLALHAAAGALLALLFCAVYYRFHACLAVALVYGAFAFIGRARGFAAAPVPRWLAVLVCVPVYALAALMLYVLWLA